MENKDKAELLNVIYEIPVLGPILSNLILLGVPVIVAGAIFFALSAISADFGASVVIFLFFFVLLKWLQYFERKTGLTMILPIPILKIYWSWLARVGIVLGIVWFIYGLFM